MNHENNSKKILTVFQPEKNPMQSGEHQNVFLGVISNLSDENFDFEEVNMGWIGSKNMEKQIELHFATIDDAREFAAKYGYVLSIKASVENEKNAKKKSYFDNFRKKYC